MRWRWLAVLLLVAGCSGDHLPDPIGNAPDAAPGAGTPLPGGLVVPDGAVRVGPVAEHGVAWSFTLAVDDDPRVAFDDVLGQLVDAGYEVGAMCDKVNRALQCDLRARRGPDEVSGSATRWRFHLTTDGDRPDPWMLALERWDPGAEPWADRDLEVPVLDVGRTPRQGDPIDPDDWNGDELTVVDGVEVVPPVFPEGCVTGGFDVDLIVTGDVDRVLDAYAEQFAPFDELGEPVRTATSVTASGFGGTDLGLEITPGEGDEPTWARMSRCDD